MSTINARPKNGDVAILVVDDYANMRRMIRNMLRELGYDDIDDAENGEQAIALVEARNYALVISDWNMSPVGGLELFDALRRLPGRGATPFIMVTARNTQDQVREALSAGIKDYVVKPFTAASLRAKVQALLDG